VQGRPEEHQAVKPRAALRARPRVVT
jgi:hypothetical protein